MNFSDSTPFGAPSPKLGRLLVVDDEVPLMTALCEMLTKQGYEAVGLASGWEALEALREREFHLLLTDLMMPGMDGIELLRAAREIDPHLVGLIMTGQGTVQTAVEAMKTGAFDYLLKPFKLSAVLPVVSRALDVRRLRMENVQLRGSVAIYELSQVIAFTLDLNTILNKTADAALQQCEADEASILLPTPEGNELYVAAVRGEGREYILGQRLSLEAGIAGWVARHRESLTLQGEVQDTRFASLHPRPDIHSAISLPMLAGNQLVGVLNVNATQRRRRFTLGQVKALTILISAAASGLANARLYEAVQQELVRRRQAEDELRAAEAKYRTLVEQIPAVIYAAALDESSSALYISPQIEMLGYTPEEWSADPRRWIKSLHPADRDRVLAELNRSHLTGEPFRPEYRLLARDGREVWFQDEAVIVRDETGRPLFLQGVLLNITERKRAEEALRQSEATQRLVLSNIDEIAYSAQLTEDDPFAGITRFVSGQVENILGYSPQEFMENPRLWSSLLRPDDVPTVKAQTIEIFASQRSGTREYRVRHKHTGEYRWMEDRIVPELGEAGRVVGIFGVVRDVTERRQAEEALQELKFIVNKSPAVAILWRATEGSPVDFVSENISQFGYTSEDFTSRKLLYAAIVHPDDLARMTLEVEQNIQAGRTEYAQEYRILTRLGETRWLDDRTWVRRDKDGIVTYYQGIIVDITERKRSEDALRENEERYRLLVETLPDGVVVHSQGRIVFANPASATIIGAASPADLTGKPVIEFVHPDYRELALKRIHQSLSEGVPAPSAEEKFVRLDGTLIDTEVSAIPFSYAGKPAMLTVFNDITERKRAEEALRNAEARYRVIFEQSPNGVLLVDLETGRTIEANDIAYKQLGYTREEFAALRISDYEALEKPEETATHMQQVIREGSGDFETLHRTKSGEIRNVHVWAKTVQLSERVLFYAIFQDITEHKQAEAALIESSAQFRTLFEASPDAIMLVDPNGNWPILDCNTAACQMSGYTRDELIGQSVDVLNLTPASPAERAEYLERIRQTRVLSLETFHRRKDGTVVPIEVSTSLIALSGRDVVLGIDRDITERKRAEEEIKHRLAELEAVNQISTALRVAQTLDEMLPMLLDTTLGALHATRGSVGLYDPVKNELRAAVTRGYGEQAGDLPLKPGEGLAGAVFASGQPYVSSDFHLDPRLSEVTRQRIPPGVGGAALPIRAGENVIGVFIINVTLPQELTPGEVHLLTTLSEIAGNAIHRTRLHEQTQQRAERLAALHTIDAAISSSLDLRVTLNILLAQVMTQLGVDAAAVLLFKPHLQTLEYAAARGFRGKGVEHSRLRLGQGYAGRAALERRTVSLPNLAEEEPDLARALTFAGEDFRAYYGVPLIAKGQVEGVLEIFHRAPLTPDPEWLEFLGALAGQAAIAIDSAQLFDDLQRSNLQLTLAYDATIEGWSRALDLRDKETEGHTRRVTEMTLHLARGMEAFTEEELVHVRRGALLHDIGKMGIPDGILLKPGPLTDDEWGIMRKHPTYAYELLSPVLYLRPALDIPYCHHEKWDGTGYPRGLKGEQIPPAARIFAVVDVWDALRSDRPYRAGWPEAKVREHLRSLTGTHFDPQAVEVFLRMMGEAL